MTNIRTKQNPGFLISNSTLPITKAISIIKKVKENQPFLNIHFLQRFVFTFDIVINSLFKHFVYKNLASKLFTFNRLVVNHKSVSLN